MALMSAPWSCLVVYWRVLWLGCRFKQLFRRIRRPEEVDRLLASFLCLCFCGPPSVVWQGNGTGVANGTVRSGVSPAGESLRP